MLKEIHDPKARPVVSVEDTFQDRTIGIALSGNLAMGVDISALEEVMAIRESTLRTWLVRSGVQGRKLHQRFFSRVWNWSMFNWMNCG